MLSSCFGSHRRRHASADMVDEEAPLLPHYDDDTQRQRRLHEKLHTYQMLRAIGQGYMPSTEQLVVLLRVGMSSDLLEFEDDKELSDAGKRLLRYIGVWLQQFMQLVMNKNEGDRLQDFLWFLTKSKVYLDVGRVEERAQMAKRRADIDTVRESVSTAFQLLLSNREFNLFLTDVSGVIRKVLQDAAFSISEASVEAGRKLQKSREASPDSEVPVSPQSNERGQTPAAQTKDQLKEDAKEIVQVAADSATTVMEATVADVADQLSGEDRAALLERLKAVIASLRRRDDYSESASTIANFIRRCLDLYSDLAGEVESEIESDIEFNKESKKAMANFWVFVQAFGNKKEWLAVEHCLKDLVDQGRRNPEFAVLVRGVGDLVQDMLLDPAFFDSPEERFREVRQQAHEWKSNSPTVQVMDQLLEHMGLAITSVFRDKDIMKLIETSQRMFNLLFPKGKFVNEYLPSDLIHVVLPRLIRAIQYIPFPRLELSTPAIDLLLESLVLEPGKTVNNSSFFPFRFRVESRNTLEVKKARFGTRTASSTLMTLKIEGLSVSAEECSFWLRTHAGILRLSDQGIASWSVDERGIDIHIDVQVCHKSPDRIFSLVGVRVKIHKLNYELRKSKFTALAWLFKPVLRPILRFAIQKKMAEGIEDGLRTLNRELLFARERWRAARIAKPDDLVAFIKAVLARFQTSPDADVHMRIGVDSREGVFEGVYTPASLVRVWEEEAVEARKRVKQGGDGGWRNRIFDMPVAEN